MVSLGATTFETSLYKAAKSGDSKMVKHILNIMNNSGYSRSTFSKMLGIGGNIALIKEMPDLDKQKLLEGAAEGDNVDVIKLENPTPATLQNLAAFASRKISVNVLYYLIEKGVKFIDVDLVNVARDADITLFSGMYENSVSQYDYGILLEATNFNNLQVLAYMKYK